MQAEEMKFFFTLVGKEASIMEEMFAQGIDSSLQGFTESDATWRNRGHGLKLECNFSGKDFGVLVRRLLETDGEYEENLAISLCSYLQIDEIWLCTDDRFYIQMYEGWLEENEEAGWILNLPYISVFDESFWRYLFKEVLRDEEV